MKKIDKTEKLLKKAKMLAIEYYELTGKPLGITGEIGEFSVAECLKLKLAEARSPGYDAIDKTGRRIQIKSRSIPRDKTNRGSHRIGSIRLDRKWDVVVLVLMDEKFELMEIYEASQAKIRYALKKPGSKARNERGALSVSKFISIGKKIWPR